MMEIPTTQSTEIPVISKYMTGKKTKHNNPLTVTEIQACLVSFLAELLEIKPEEIDVTIPFDRYGLDSVAAAGIIGDLDDLLGSELDPTLIYDYPTIKALAEHLSEEGHVKK